MYIVCSIKEFIINWPISSMHDTGIHDTGIRDTDNKIK